MSKYIVSGSLISRLEVEVEAANVLEAEIIALKLYVDDWHHTGYESVQIEHVRSA